MKSGECLKQEQRQITHLDNKSIERIASTSDVSRVVSPQQQVSTTKYYDHPY